MKNIAILIMITLIAGCSEQTQKNSTSEPTSVSTTESVATKETEPVSQVDSEFIYNSEKIAEVFKVMSNIDKVIIYTEDDDPNRLLNRPDQYVGKINFVDKRYKKEKLGGTVEVFNDLERLEARRKYVEDLGKSSHLGLRYQFVHKNLLLRIDRELTPKQAKEYEEAVSKL